MAVCILETEIKTGFGGQDRKCERAWMYESGMFPSSNAEVYVRI